MAACGCDQEHHLVVLDIGTREFIPYCQTRNILCPRFDNIFDALEEASRLSIETGLCISAAPGRCPGDVYIWDLDYDD